MIKTYTISVCLREGTVTITATASGDGDIPEALWVIDGEFLGNLRYAPWGSCLRVTIDPEADLAGTGVLSRSVREYPTPDSATAYAALHILGAGTALVHAAHCNVALDGFASATWSV